MPPASGCFAIVLSCSESSGTPIEVLKNCQLASFNRKFAYTYSEKSPREYQIFDNSLFSAPSNSDNVGLYLILYQISSQFSQSAAKGLTSPLRSPYKGLLNRCEGTRKRPKSPYLALTRGFKAAFRPLTRRCKADTTRLISRLLPSSDTLRRRYIGSNQPPRIRPAVPYERLLCAFVTAIQPLTTAFESGTKPFISASVRDKKTFQEASKLFRSGPEGAKKALMSLFRFYEKICITLATGLHNLISSLWQRS